MKVVREPGPSGMVIIHDTYPDERRIYVSPDELDQLILGLETARDNPDSLAVDSGYEVNDLGAQ